MRLHKNCDESKLTEYGFSKYGTKYMYKTILYRYKKTTVIEMITTVEMGDNPTISYDVLANDDIYIPYYNNEYSSNNLVLRKVKRRVNTEIKKLKESEIIEPEPKHHKCKSKR